MKQIKKIFIGSLAIALLSISITVIQMSCTKSAAASPTGVTSTPIGKLLFDHDPSIPGESLIITDYNGNILDSITKNTFADSLSLIGAGYNGAALSPNGQDLFFLASGPSSLSSYTDLYKYDLNAHTCILLRRDVMSIYGAY